VPLPLLPTVANSRCSKGAATPNSAISVSYDGTDLTVPGYARSSELTSLANTVSALGTRVGNIEALLANNSLSITADEAEIIKNAECQLDH
jgi:hypothetical protein